MPRRPKRNPTELEAKTSKFPVSCSQQAEKKEQYKQEGRLTQAKGKWDCFSAKEVRKNYQMQERNLGINVNGKPQQLNTGRKSVNPVNPDPSGVYGSLLQVKNRDRLRCWLKVEGLRNG